MQVPLIATSESLPERLGEPDCPVSRASECFSLQASLDTMSAHVIFTQLPVEFVSVLPEDSKMQVWS